MKKKILFFTFPIFCFFVELAHSAEYLTFGVVPQQSTKILMKKWKPIFNEVSNKSGITIRFATAKNIPAFEKRLAEGHYDLAYMNPYHYVNFNKIQGYQALNKARDKRIKGIIVSAKKNKLTNLKALDQSILAFPSPGAFAASMLTRSDLVSDSVSFKADYVSTHDAVYAGVASGEYLAGGGVLRTFKSTHPKIREQLEILWSTKGYTPHAIAAHPRVNADMRNLIQKAFTELEADTKGKKLLKNIKIKGFEKATDKDWNDVRALNLTL